MQNQDSDLLFTAEDSLKIDVRSIGVHNLGQAYVNFTNADLNENVENKKEKTVETLIKDLYATIGKNLHDRFENSEVILNPIFAYISHLEQRSPRLNTYCNVPNPYDDFVAFYNALNSSVPNFDNWPTDIKDDYSSLRLYSILLNNADRLRVPSKVVQVKPEKLVKQWMQPLPGLGSSPRKSSSFIQEENLLKEIWENLRKDNLEKTAELRVRRELTLYGLQRKKDTDMLRDSLLSAELTKANLLQ
ncbi:hypothetical protein ANCCAN_21462 [Ancylostoma caninum]|uniref:Uncharacterized protein n=1 Tax=Ancylostoma caninum TaxID=29170 RepID=A0A368FKZ4_ANCCA|nr:hypothetical protein ANCCAN_21462 [Ancylostoma caninum]